MAQVVITSVALDCGEAAAVHLLQSITGVSGSGTPAPALGKADVHTALFVIRADSAVANASLGEVVVTWKRPR